MSNNDQDRDPLEKGVDFLKGLAKSFVRADDAGRFFHAVRRNDTLTVKKMLAGGFDVSTCDESGKTALHAAAGAGSIDCAQALFDYGADLCQGKKDDPGHLPIDEAANYGRINMVRFLAGNGGYRPGLSSRGRSVLHRACEKGKADIVEALLSCGADPNEAAENGTTPLLAAVAGKHLSLIRLLLKDPRVMKALPHHFVDTDPKKRNALEIAIDQRRYDIVRMMIENGADVNMVISGKTPLMQAIDAGDERMVRLLAELGADLNKPHPVLHDRTRPLFYACRTGAIDYMTSALMINTLVSCGADPDVASFVHGLTPLLVLCRNGANAHQISALLKSGADIHIISKEGDFPLFYLAQFNDYERIPLLVQAGANPNQRHAQKGTTPLIEAIKNKNTLTAETLLKLGADPRLPDKDGHSPMSYAKETKLSSLVSILEGYKTLPNNDTQHSQKPSSPKP